MPTNKGRFYFCCFEWAQEIWCVLCWRNKGPGCPLLIWSERNSKTGFRIRSHVLLMSIDKQIRATNHYSTPTLPPHSHSNKQQTTTSKGNENWLFILRECYLSDNRMGNFYSNQSVRRWITRCQLIDVQDKINQKKNYRLLWNRLYWNIQAVLLLFLIVKKLKGFGILADSNRSITIICGTSSQLENKRLSCFNLNGLKL